MSEMVRKQIYIEKRQQVLLKRVSKARKVSEAKVIREALDQALGGGMEFQQPRGSEQALSEFVQFALSRQKQAGQEPYRWNREELYEDRLSRWGTAEEETH